MRRPGAPEIKSPLVAGILTQQTEVGAERLELGIVVQAPYIRQTLQLLDNPGAGLQTAAAAASSARPASAAAAGGAP